MHRDTHIVDHVDDVFDLLRIDDVIRQVIIDLGVGQVTLFLAARTSRMITGQTLVVDGGVVVTG